VTRRGRRACSGVQPGGGSDATPRHETGSGSKDMNTSASRQHEPDERALIDDATFITELERLEIPRVRRRVAAPVVIPRGANRWNLHPPPGGEPERRVRAVERASARSGTWMPILFGLCFGAGGAAVVLHDRVARILELLVR
jgi:hypothetical protein